MGLGTAIKRPRLFEMLVERLRADIASGVHPPGEHLPSERALMARFGVGRSAVREALFALQRSGQIRIRSGERALVLEPDAPQLTSEMAAALRRMIGDDAGMRHFQDVRLAVEGAFARRAALLATSEELAGIRAALEANKSAAGNAELLHRSDLDFHLAVARVGGNPLIDAMNDAVHQLLVEQRRTSIAIPEAAELATRWHERIYQAIAARNPDAALAAMEGHLRMVQDFYWRVRDLQRDVRQRQEQALARLAAREEAPKPA